MNKPQVIWLGILAVGANLWACRDESRYAPPIVTVTNPTIAVQSGTALSPTKLPSWRIQLLKDAEYQEQDYNFYDSLAKLKNMQRDHKAEGKAMLQPCYKVNGQSERGLCVDAYGDYAAISPAPVYVWIDP